ncbi:YbhB/YbcL family Raf kinase inhibitor-like protein [Kitasatospora sp. NPDC059146]|uniref:YbhB/YbcL family Raf kinase inhibitor-like protein n=1 Tax=Kitasatospora sp. NPDC059146 TaxID=3346741 RepID=UPI0036972F44
MSVLGTLLRNRRPEERTYAWNQPCLDGPETLTLTSRDFTDAGLLPTRHSGTRVGGENLSPHLAWSTPPAGTAELLLVVEDIDVPLGSNPAVHCLALLDGPHLPSPQELAPGALAKSAPAPGVTLLRSFIGRGYHGPEPLKGHGPHRYVFELYALAEPLPNRAALPNTRPRRLLTSLTTPVLARGRITGTSER